MNLNRHRTGKFLPKGRLHLGNQLLQRLFSVGAELNVQLCILPCPLRARQGAPGHGIPADKKLHQLPGLHAVQLGLRVRRSDLQLFQAVELRDLLSGGIQQPLGDIGLRVDGNPDSSGFGINNGSSNGRLRKGLTQLLRRLIVRKHIQQEYSFFHR